MDKRTIFFAITLSLTLFGVNSFFDWQSQGQKDAYSQAQKTSRVQAIERLKSEIAEKKEDVPTENLTYDKENQKFAAAAFKQGSNYLFIKPQGFNADTLYANGTALHPVFLSKEGFSIFSQEEPPAPLKLAEYKEFGHYDLILLQGTQSFNAALSDGSFSLPISKLDTLSKEVEGKEYVPQFKDSPGIVLAHDGSALLPLGLYQNLNRPLELFQSMGGFKTETAKTKALEKQESAEQTFYVLENDTLQLVISTTGGAVSEINLPFLGKDFPQSVVRPIEFDREILKDSPQNAWFPSTPALAYSPKGEPLPRAREAGGFYPLIRRNLVHQGNKLHRLPSKYYAFNIISEYPETAELPFKVKQFTGETIVLESVQGHRKITKTYTLLKKGAPYTFTLKIDLQGDSRGLWLTSGVPEAELVSGSPAPSLQYRISKGGKPEVNSIDLPKDVINVTTVTPDWICNSNAFFGIILDPLKTNEPGYRAAYVSGKDAPSRLVVVGEEYGRFNAADLPGYMTMLPLNAKGGSMEFRFFTGPYSAPILRQVDEAFADPAIGYNPDYIACQTFHGWFSFISEPFAKFLFFLMNFFHSLTGSWGFSIILLTIALRIMLYPLNAWSAKSMLKMQQIAPKVQEVQAKYKNDQKKAQLEIMNLYRESGANPFSGCFPLLVQMPFLIGMFDLLKSSFQLRGASFVPGWIDNLTSPDVLFSWNTPIPLIGTEFHLLPIFLGLIMLIQPQLTSPLPKDKSQWTDQQRQQRTMGTMMAVVFTWMFYSFPSGLNIYWISSMLLGMLQQWWTKRKMDREPLLPAAPPKKKK